MPNQNNVVLIILDGFGLSPIEQGNAIIKANTPFFDFALRNYMNVSLQASGDAVGLPWGEVGNSEVGHINLGAGRVVLQDYPQISASIENGSFFNRPAFLQALEHVKKHASRLHLIGIASNGAVHGHVDHCLALIDLAQGGQLTNVAIHIIADGRDTPPKSLKTFIDQINGKLIEKPVGSIVSVVGRYFAMDRDKRWERTERAYRLFTQGQGTQAHDIARAIDEAYSHGQSDEFMEPMVIGKPVVISDNDAVIFWNYRPDRAIQLTKALIDPKFDAFTRAPLKNVLMVTMTNYEDSNLPAAVAFTTVDLANPSTNPLTHPVAEIVAQANLPQLHIAETEKYAHVTYFFNNGVRTLFRKEAQVLVPSPKVATYDLKPEMSAAGITDQFMKRSVSAKPQFTVINFANADMVGHTGKLEPTIKAIEYMDTQLLEIVPYALEQGAFVFITADHGNAERMINIETGEPDKEHTLSPVPFFVIPPGSKKPMPGSGLTIKEKITIFSREPVGLLADVAPSMLEALQLQKPYEMTGASLLNLV